VTKFAIEAFSPWREPPRRRRVFEVVSGDGGDPALWQALRAGNVDALGALFDRHAAQIYRYAVRIAETPQDAEDALSEVFLEVWRARRNLELREGSAVPLLLAITKRLVQKQQRSGRRRRVRDAAEARSTRTIEADFAEALVREDELSGRRIWLRAQVAALPTDQRAVYELCVYGELSQQEAAEALQIPVGTAKSRLFRARSSITEAARHAFGVADGSTK
jgi:RNA polymerase sigma factor (sigma-70 family)